MKRFFLIFLITVFVFGSFIGRADETANITLNLDLPEYFTGDLTLGTAIIDIDIPMPPQNGVTTWCENTFTLRAIFDTSSSRVDLFVRATALIDGAKTINGGIQFEGTEAFACTPIELGTSDQSVCYWDIDLFQVKNGSGKLGFTSSSSDEPGNYTSTVTFTLMAT